MEKRSFATPHGDIWLWGEPEAFDGDKPIILAILGFAAPLERFFPLQTILPEAAGLVAHLPGNHTPPLDDCSVETFASAYSHVIATTFAGRPLILLGESLGGLVVLTMDVPHQHRLALDPPFRSPSDTKFVDQCRGLLRQEPHHADLAWAMLGVSLDAVEPRDFTALIGRPARVLVGSRTAPIRPDEAQSVVGDAERAALLRAPDVWLTVIEAAGHVLAARGSGVIVAILRQMLADIARTRPPA